MRVFSVLAIMIALLTTEFTSFSPSILAHGLSHAPLSIVKSQPISADRFNKYADLLWYMISTAGQQVVVSASSRCSQPYSNQRLRALCNLSLIHI